MKFTLLALLFTVSVTQVYAWERDNDPRDLLGEYTSQMDLLPMSSELSQIPWSDSGWGRSKGGIAYRWQREDASLRYRILDERDVKRLSPSELQTLSPAEKFDLLNNDYTFSFTEKIKRQNPLNRPEWEGICHGWSLASIHHPQGKPTTFTNKSGLKIPFGSSDIAAILSYYYAHVKKGGIRLIGRRCNGNIDSTSSACLDINPGAFHLVLGNMIGLRGKAFIMDVSQDYQVFNVPVAGYESTVLDERVAGANLEVLIQSDVKYIVEGQQIWEPFDLQNEAVHRYEYWLEINPQNEIIGGRWESKLRPDFVWYADKDKLRREYAPFDL